MCFNSSSYFFILFSSKCFLFPVTFWPRCVKLKAQLEHVIFKLFKNLLLILFLSLSVQWCQFIPSKRHLSLSGDTPEDMSSRSHLSPHLHVELHNTENRVKVTDFSHAGQKEAWERRPAAGAPGTAGTSCGSTWQTVPVRGDEDGSSVFIYEGKKESFVGVLPDFC